MAALLSDDRTGYPHPKCYAAASSDCSRKVSKEHWLSDNIIRSAGQGKAVLMSGMPWQEGRQHTLTAKALGSNVLCERHNSALSSVDLAAGELFRVLDDFQSDLQQHPDPHGHEFAVFHGDVIERWLLKLFWGAVASGTIGEANRPIPSLRSEIEPGWLADVLFRGEAWPEGWGLYMAGRRDQLFSGQAAVALQPITGPDHSLWGGSVEFGAVAFRLYLGAPTWDRDTIFQRHPLGVFLDYQEQRVQKILALAWDSEGSDPIVLTRLGDGTVDRDPSDA